MNRMTQSEMSRKLGECREEFQILSEENGLAKAAARYRFPAGFAGFDGHFPGDPMLPGVLVAAMALETAAALLGHEVRLEEVRRAKYFRRVRPGMAVTAEVTAEVSDGGAVTLGVTAFFSGEPPETVAKLQLKGTLA